MSDNERHVMPINDLIAHTSDDNCVCSPQAERVQRDDGTDAGWIYIHHSLDGREHGE